MAEKPFTIIVDTREQNPWIFTKRAPCLGVENIKLDTGDYSLKGYENRLTIERKGSTSEFATNVFEERFERELCRLDELEFPFIFLEFEMKDLMEFPNNSGIPKYRWKYLRTTPSLLVKRYYEIRLNHPKIMVEFVGQHGRSAALSLFKRVVDHDEE